MTESRSEVLARAKAALEARLDDPDLDPAERRRIEARLAHDGSDPEDD